MSNKVIKIQDETEGNENYVTKNIQACVGYWNKQGEDIVAKNITGELGSKETNKMVREQTYQDFILDCLLCDCKTFANSDMANKTGIKFEVGRTSSHIWIHEDSNRVLMIHF